MMQRSTGGERELEATLAMFEPLVMNTARMFAPKVRREVEDLAQELRVRVWRAVMAYDPARSQLPLKRYVFGVMTNKVRDFKRDAAREAGRRERFGLAFVHIEDTRTLDDDDTAADRFDALYHFATHDEVYGEVEREPFELPATVQHSERLVLVLLTQGATREEAAVVLGITSADVTIALTALREKLADWRSTRTLVATLAAA